MGKVVAKPKYDRKLPKVCTYCGSPLKIGKRKPFCGKKFNSDGSLNEKIEYRLDCSANLIRRFFGVHDHYLIVENLLSAITKKPHRTILCRR